jgi:aspartyl-tRNA(Asn)/glutamyl-tRNA(Gln) amidotransferase subunit B
VTANEEKVAEYRDGKGKLFGFVFGQTMKTMEAKPTRRSSMTC